MPYNITEFKKLAALYGRYGGWAIWEYAKSRSQEASTECIYKNLHQLNSNNVIIGLNVSEFIKGDWHNFRAGRHDRKLKYAFNDSDIRGAYMTDLYKGIVDPKSLSLHKELNNNYKVIEQNVHLFIQEMKDIGIKSDTRFILMGTEKSITGTHFITYYKIHFANNPVVFHRHYSSRGTDEDWVKSMWAQLGINKDFNETINKYI